MLTVIDIDEATLEAEATAEQWEQEFQRAFTGPARTLQAVQSFLSLPPEMAALVQGDRNLIERGRGRAETLRREMSPAL